MANAESEPEAAAREENTEVAVTGQVWEQHKIDREKTMGDDRLLDQNPIAQP